MIRVRSLQPASCLFTALLLIACPLQAADPLLDDGIQVDSTADAVDDVIDGICADVANRCTLRAAIQEANAAPGAQLIELPAGNFLLTVPGAQEDDAASGDLDITDSLDIVGAGSAVTVIDANGMVLGDRALHMRSIGGATVTVSLTDLAVVNGQVLNENGGGLLLLAEEGAPAPGNIQETTLSLSLQRVLVAGNSAASDMIDPGNGQPVGGSGGGIYATGSLTLLGSEVSQNIAAANGGGIYAGAAVQLADSSLMDNQAEGGGGLFETGSHTSFYERCAIVGNAATGGGGVATRTQVALDFLNCTIHGNTATDVGAGINSNGIINLRFSTVTANASDSDAPNGGAGLNSFANGSFRLWSTILAANTVNSTTDPLVRNCGCSGGGGCTTQVQFLSFNHNLDDGASCGLGQPQDQINTDPLLAPLALERGPTPSREPLPGSPAIDAGHGAPECPAVDQRGITRPQDGSNGNVFLCDVGSVERLSELIFADQFED